VLTVTNLPIAEDDEDERNTPIGVFNYAESYWQAARALKQTKPKSTHPDAPVSFLYYHAIELYLKSFLRMHGHTAKELRGKQFGHRVCCLKERSKQLGLMLMDEDVESFSLLATTDAIIRSRYLQTGSFYLITSERLEGVCINLRESVGRALKSSGIHVRL
jgi:hypothetical protein